MNEYLARERLAGYQPMAIAGAKVALVGAGALGQNAALTLALSGIGQIAIVDGDSFEEANRTRSPYYTRGEGKAAAVAHGVFKSSTATNPKVHYHNGLVQEVGDLLARWSDVVISAVDSQVGRAYLAERCRIHRTPLVEAGFHGFDMSMSAFQNQSSEEPCWSCGRGTPDDGKLRGLCSLYARQAEEKGFIPAVQSVAQSAGAVVAETAIAMLHGTSELSGRRWTMNLRSGRSVLASLRLDHECAGTHTPAQHAPIQIDIRADDTLAKLIRVLGRVKPGLEELMLSEAFIEHLPCARCGRPIRVRQPAWLVHSAPVCQSRCCEEDIAPQGPSMAGVVPASPCHLHERSCQEIGLGPGAWVRACWENESRWVQLVGSLVQVFQTLDGDACAEPSNPNPDKEKLSCPPST